MPFCSSCGAPINENSRFCRNCGTATEFTSAPTEAPSSVQFAGQKQQTQESVYYKGEGMLLLKTIEERGRFRRDKKSKSRAEGELIVTNKAIYCAGNDYPFDRILTLTKDGRKTVVLTFENDVAVGGKRGAVSIEAELRMNSRETCDELFQALQRARTSHLMI